MEHEQHLRDFLFKNTSSHSYTKEIKKQTNISLASTRGHMLVSLSLYYYKDSLGNDAIE